MSQDNVEAMRRFVEAVNEGGADADLDLLDPEVEFHEDPTFPEATIYRGRDAVVDNFREFTASFDGYRFEIEDVREAGGDRVLAVFHEHARGRASGLDVHRRSGWVATFRDGKVLHVEIYLAPADAFEAVGLRE